ncbi:peptidylprolyl isomerase [Undibacterium cyanobacteriorum]|uniref:peptidylprolyl isomerase n=1 Tax=Undibacterium cyanobacteriorum TaxID=3073561 RepID=A0ABY9RKG2_9BURK|nr:peptidylprolyl isomerase [Undibacterium sp. 20NA77.5]WMW81710.1 peptidylprolyl isomerase [Undibacterium sp. 20NA77.5]
MPVIVNDYELSDAEMEKELPQHQDAADPLKSAMTSLVLRRVLLDKAKELALQGDDEQKIESLLAREVIIPEASLEECRRYYELHQPRFLTGELVEANHILFQVTANVDLDALRQRAQSVLDELLQNPDGFAAAAKSYSNCPSAEVGGNLGQLSRGETVPEFEKPVFSAAAHSLLPRLIETRFGLHIVQLGRKVAGRLIPFEQVQHQIADAMKRASYDRALQQYLKVLVGQAQISGIELAGADGPLLQ